MSQDLKAAEQPLLEASELSKRYRRGGGVFSTRTDGPGFAAVDHVRLRVAEGETFAVVGESGCGKTTLARLILRLIEPDSGDIRFAGQQLLSLDASHLRSTRRQMQMVFQDPFASLDPRMRAGEIVADRSPSTTRAFQKRKDGSTPRRCSSVSE